jgi:hypothetical protein
MVFFFKVIGFALFLLGIINGILSVLTKDIIKKYGYSTIPFFSQISDIKKLRNLIDKDDMYKILYYANIITSILFILNVITLFALVFLSI